jgi:hypothetical protein
MVAFSFRVLLNSDNTFFLVFRLSSPVMRIRQRGVSNNGTFKALLNYA